MKDYWIRTWKLIREHPALLAPAIFAGLLSLGMARLSKTALKLILNSFATGHSVLGGEVPNGDFENLQHKAMLVGMPLGLGREYLTVVVFVVAFVVTARQVRVALDGAVPEVPSSVKFVLSRWRSILLFSLAFMAILGVLTGIGTTVLTFPTTLAHLSAPAFHLAVFIASLIATSLMAGILAPWSLRLLQQPESALTATVKLSARTLAMAAFALQPVLGDILLRTEARMAAGQKWEATGLSVINTVATNLPLALLFVVLGLLAREPGSTAMVESEGQPPALPFASEASADSASVTEA